MNTSLLFKIGYIKSNFVFSSPSCQFYVFVTGSCYLGNVLTNTSAITARSDAQTFYIYQGEYETLLNLLKNT